MIPDDNELLPEETTGYRPGSFTVLLTLLLVLAMLTTLLWPLLYTRSSRRPTPTPTPSFLLEARTLPAIPLRKIPLKSKEPLIVMKGSLGCKGSLLLTFLGGGFWLEPSAQPNPIIFFVGPAPFNDIIARFGLKIKADRV